MEFMTLVGRAASALPPAGCPGGDAIGLAVDVIENRTRQLEQLKGELDVLDRRYHNAPNANEGFRIGLRISRKRDEISEARAALGQAKRIARAKVKEAERRGVDLSALLELAGV